jgi:hypothetical protein
LQIGKDVAKSAYAKNIAVLPLLEVDLVDEACREDVW